MNEQSGMGGVGRGRTLFDHITEIFFASPSDFGRLTLPYSNQLK